MEQQYDRNGQPVSPPPWKAIWIVIAVCVGLWFVGVMASSTVLVQRQCTYTSTYDATTGSAQAHMVCN